MNYYCIPIGDNDPEAGFELKPSDFKPSAKPSELICKTYGDQKYGQLEAQIVLKLVLQVELPLNSGYTSACVHPNKPRS